MYNSCYQCYHEDLPLPAFCANPVGRVARNTRPTTRWKTAWIRIVLIMVSTESGITNESMYVRRSRERLGNIIIDIGGSDCG